MRSALKQNLPVPAGTFSFPRPRCYTCSLLNTASSISGPKSNFFINLFNFTCTSSNIIHCISCSKCCKLYIGERGRRLSDRFAEHLSFIRNNDVEKPVVRHFNAANHSISDIKVCANSSISGGNDSRKKTEKASHLKNLNHSPPTHSMNDFLLFDYFIVSVFVQHVQTKAVT